MEQVDTSALIAQWMRYSAADRIRAQTRAREGDLFGAELAVARGEVRKAAALLLQQLRDDPLGAARLMHREAAAIWVAYLPLIGFDPVALTYTRARTWQDCARTIDPSLPIVQKRLDLD